MRIGKKVRVYTKYYDIDINELSEKLLRKICFECDVRDINDTFISEEQLNDMLVESAVAFAIFNKKDKTFFKDFQPHTEKYTPEWTHNVRDAFIYPNEDKLYKTLNLIKDETLELISIPLIHQVDPLFKY